MAPPLASVLRVGDFNGDGLPDIYERPNAWVPATPVEIQTTPVIWLNTGSGLESSFEPRQATHFSDDELVLADLQSLIAERLPLLPPLRWRLAEVPLGLDYPYWVDDPDFDLDFHVRELALPRPGNDEQLAEQVARIVSRPLDRARPLWELYLIHGLEAGHVGDADEDPPRADRRHVGRGDHGPAPRPRRPRAASSPPPRAGATTRAPERARDARPRPAGPAALSAARAARAARGAARTSTRRRSATSPAPDARGALAERPARDHRGEAAARAQRRCTAPQTTFNGRISPHRRFAFGQLPLDDVKAVKNVYGCTVNDVVVSICAGAVRRWLIEHDELPDEPLVAQIPVSVRTDEQMGTYGNRIMLMSAPLFTD